MIPPRNLLSVGIGAAAMVIIAAPAQSAVFDGPAPSSTSALVAAPNGLMTEMARELAKPTARLLVAQGRPQNDRPQQGRARQGSKQQAPGPPDWAGGKPPSVPPVSPRRPLG